jgi:hypothetical protein
MYLNNNVKVNSKDTMMGIMKEKTKDEKKAPNGNEILMKRGFEQTRLKNIEDDLKKK